MVIPKEILDAIKTFQNNGFDTTKLKKAVLRKAELELGGKPIKKEKPKSVNASDKPKTDEQLIADHIQNNGVITKRKGNGVYWNGTQFKEYEKDNLGKKEIASRTRLPVSNLNIDILFLMIGNKDWFTCRQLTELHFHKFDNELDKTVRVELYKSVDLGLIINKLQGKNRYFYKLSDYGFQFINKKTGGR